MQIHMLYKINYFFFLLKTYVLSLEYLKLSLYLSFRFIAQCFIIFVLCIYIYFHKYDSLFRSSPSWVFLLKVSGEFAEWFPCRSVISIELLCSFVGVTLRRGCSVNLLCKVLLSLIVHFKGTLTYFCLCFVHDSQIFNILQLLLTICISSYICVNCVHNLTCFFSFR